MLKSILVRIQEPLVPVILYNTEIDCEMERTVLHLEFFS